MTTPRHETPFQQFEENIRYAEGLVIGGRALEGIRGIPNMNFGALSAAHPEDLYRAAWNQAVSALDHWLHREIIDRAVILTNDMGRERPAALQRLPMPFAMVERMHTESMRDVFREYLEDELSRITYQRSQRITEGLRLILTDKPSEIWAKVGANLAMTPEAVKAYQDAIVIRRNRIAHEADLDAQGNRTPMTGDEAEVTVEWIRKLAAALAQILGS
ncbi:hypothetical protein [Actinomadura sp. 7K507]|uniref:hypothetical protein n=1 Tax=Actinomadura sp. 7K507 TaxID=2530365 RepID=UPI00104324A3|nr:hypothetical protein [Actinomadura sp. 7K507]TDC96134.1 hypothetical protein E1285_05990 [Actinomadura sp. 7K507]